MSITNRKPLRIAHLTPAYFSPDSVVGGGERYVYYVAQAVRSVDDVEQCVFAIGEQDRLFSHDGIPVRILRNESPKPGGMNGFSSALWRELRGFDLVHIHQSLTLFGAYSLAIVRSLGIPAIGTDLGGGNSELMLSRRGLDLYDGVVSISRYAHDLIAAFYGGAHEIMIGPVDAERFCPDHTVARDNRTVLCAGRLLPHKGVDRIIAALPSELRLVVVGRVYDDRYYQLLRDMARDKDVHFIHDADDVALMNWYRTAALFVQASTARDIYGNTSTKAELMGLTTLEAMACGIAVAVANTASLPELVPDRRFGRVFSNHDDLVAIFSELVRGEWPDKTASVLAREHVMQHHAMSPIGARMADFYRQVLLNAKAA